MRFAYTPQQIRDAEQPLLEAGEPLMARAAFALYQHVVRALRARVERGGRVVVLVGPGNNGGDALFAAALLAKRPIEVTVVLLGERVHEAGLSAVRSSQARIVSCSSTEITDDLVALIRSADTLVDGLLGIGAVGAPRGNAGELLRRLAFNKPRASGAHQTGSVAGATSIDRIDESDRPTVIAVDVPSGVNCATGQVEDRNSILAADLTVTFGALKVGLVAAPGCFYAGTIETVDIGLELLGPTSIAGMGDGAGTDRLVGNENPIRELEASDFRSDPLLRELVERPAPDAHKYTRGVAAVLSGTARFPGAGVLATSAALHSGLGMIRYLGAAAVAERVTAAMPEIVTVPGRVQAWTVGSGYEPGDATRRAVLEVLGQPEAAVIDAGAIASLTYEDTTSLHARHILTPHAGELAVLLTRLGTPASRTDVEDNLLSAARTAHELTGATIVAKGPATVIAGRNGTYIQNDGTPRLATAGSGDVLAGILVAAAARVVAEVEQTSGGDVSANDHIDWAKITAAGVILHGLAGRLAAGELLGDSGSRPLSASQVALAVPGVHAYLAGDR
jgi:hydroxyethylthiazole kinase-like uncharacterized protein yjeF